MVSCTETAITIGLTAEALQARFVGYTVRGWHWYLLSCWLCS